MGLWDLRGRKGKGSLPGGVLGYRSLKTLGLLEPER